MRVLRFDTVRLDKAEPGPAGSLRIQAYPTRAGVLVYRDREGKEVRELRPPSAVFDAASLASLAGAPLTERHPAAGRVDPTSRKSLAIGHVGDAVTQDAHRVAATVYVTDADAIGKIQSGALKELSAGYYADTIDEPGVWEGQPFDRRQANIEYNHLALLGPGEGRAGPECALRLDAMSCTLDEYAPAREATPMALRIDGKDHDPATPEAQAAVNAIVAARDTAQGALAAATAKAATLQTKLDAATDPKRLAGEVKARMTLLRSLDKGYEVAGLKFDAADPAIEGSTAADLIKQAIADLAPEIDINGKSDEYIAGVFATLISSKLGGTEPTATDALPPPGNTPPEMQLNGASRQDAARARLTIPGKIARDANGRPTKTDAAEETDPEILQRQAYQDMHTKPLAATRG